MKSFRIALLTVALATSCAPPINKKPADPAKAAPAPIPAASQPTPPNQRTQSPSQATSGGQLLPPGSASGASQAQPSGAPSAAPSQAPSATPEPQTVHTLPNPQQALTDILTPDPAPEQEAKRELQVMLWLKLSGDGDNLKDHPGFPNVSQEERDKHLKAQVHIREALPLKPNRTDQAPNGRFISEEIELGHPMGHKTKGWFEFRHPVNGTIENFHTDHPESKTELETATNDLHSKPHSFEIEIRIPIDQVTGETLLELPRLYRELDAARAANEANDTRDTQRKLRQAEMFLRIQQGKIKDYILNPAFDPWLKSFLCKPGQDPKKNNCKEWDWVLEKRIEDEIAFFREFDKPAERDRLKTEWDQALANTRAYAAKVGAGQVNPPLPPPPPTGDAVVDAADQPVILKTAGQPSGTLEATNRIKLVFFGDGFTAAEKSKFYEKAQEKWDYLFGSETEKGIEPFKSYRRFFIGIAIFTASAESGSCHRERRVSTNVGCMPTDPGYVAGKTAFETYFGNQGMARLLGMNRIGFERIGNLLRTRVPDFDLGTILINDAAYGGAGGQYAMTSLDRSSGEVIAHELMGHSFAKLGDEYTTPYPNFPDTEEINTSRDKNTFGSDKWAAVLAEYAESLKGINAQTQIKKQDDFEEHEGAHYNEKGWWRPEDNCKMRMLGREFCDVCRAGIIKAIYNEVKPIDTAVPSGNELVVKQGEAWSFKITTMSDAAQVRWFVGDKKGENFREITEATGPELSSATPGHGVDKGEYTVRVKVKDFIQLAPQGANASPVNPNAAVATAGKASPLEQVREWKLNVKKKGGRFGF
ncbi:MAG TPA: M64 family metallopeptidase [Bdellovibrionota bacterium]|nr:M64 family metallopeptidase [Bdellovibrionota bacterium]